MEIEKTGWQLSFKVAADIQDEGQTIYMGYFTIQLDECDVSEILNVINKLNPGLMAEVDASIAEEYQREKAKYSGKWKPMLPEDVQDRKKKSGYVYFMKVEDQDLFKIGVSSSGVESRIQNLQTSCPYKIEPYCVLLSSCCTQYESAFHKYFHKHRGSGEWFHITAAMVDEAVKNVKVESFN